MSPSAADNWYADTAYDSRKKKDLPPPDPAAWKGPKERTLRAHPLPIGVYCGDYRIDLEKKEVEDLKKGIHKNDLNHEYTEMATLANPKVAFATLQYVAGAFTVIGVVTFLFMSSKGYPIGWDTTCVMDISAAIFILSTILRKIVPNKNNYVFNRRTGLVTFPKAKRVIPFAELDGYYFCSQTTVNVNYQLYLGHRYTPFGVTCPSDWHWRSRVHLDWEFLQQYMDTSMPLPDVPELEPYRHLDPTTAAHDKEHNRPPRYWHDMPLEQVEKEQKEGAEVVKSYPWSRLRADHIPKEAMDKLLPGARLFS
jgi:hypothetical protein